jgi:thiol-disulfide isomerase/thioredoxin
MKKYVAISVSFLVLAGFFMPSVSFAADTVPPELQGIMEQLKASLASLKANENTQSGSAASMASFAQCIEKSGAKFYGASWCPHCQSQKALFGQSAGLLPYTECSINNGAGVSSLCLNKSITAYPTWDFKDGTRKTGTQSLAALAQATGCVPPEKSTQFVEIKVPQTIIQITAPAMGANLGFGRSFKVLWNEKDSAPKSFLMGVKNGNGETTYPGKAIRTKSGTYTWKNPSFMKKAGDYTLEFYKVPEKGKIPTEVIASTRFTVSNSSHVVTNKNNSTDSNDKSIMITSPQKDWEVEKGQVLNIKWDSKNIDTIRLMLFGTQSIPYPIMNLPTIVAIPNDGYYAWKVSESLPEGDGYRLFIYDGTTGGTNQPDLNEWDASETFSIVAGTGVKTKNADLNSDKKVDGADLGLLIAAWGECPATTGCPADLNSDRLVDNKDLMLLTGSWSK